MRPILLVTLFFSWPLLSYSQPDALPSPSLPNPSPPSSPAPSSTPPSSPPPGPAPLAAAPSGSTPSSPTSDGPAPQGRPAPSPAPPAPQTQNNFGQSSQPESTSKPPSPGQKTGDWIRDLDLGKLVGAATAPVNLIIAATVAISFLIAKQDALLAKFLLILDQYKKGPEDELTSEKLFHQLGIYALRLRLINWAGRALGVTIFAFIGTVTLTSIGVLFPDLTWVKIGTGFSLLAGLLSMLVGIVLQIGDGSMEARAIALEMKEVDATREKKN